MSILAGRNGQVSWNPTGTVASPATLTPIASIDSWKASFKTDKIPVTCFGDTNKVYVAGLPDISGSFGGFWNSTESALFAAAESSTPGLLKLAPNTTESTYYWSGLAYMDADIDVAVNGAPKVTGTFVAAGPWTRAHS